MLTHARPPTSNSGGPLPTRTSGRLWDFLPGQTWAVMPDGVKFAAPHPWNLQVVAGVGAKQRLVTQRRGDVAFLQPASQPPDAAGGARFDSGTYRWVVGWTGVDGCGRVWASVDRCGQARACGRGLLHPGDECSATDGARS